MRRGVNGNRMQPDTWAAALRWVLLVILGTVGVSWLAGQVGGWMLWPEHWRAPAVHYVWPEPMEPK